MTASTLALAALLSVSPPAVDKYIQIGEAVQPPPGKIVTFVCWLSEPNLVGVWVVNGHRIFAQWGDPFFCRYLTPLDKQKLGLVK